MLVKLLREKSELTQEAAGKALAGVLAVAEGLGFSASLVEDLVRLLRGPNASAERTALQVREG